MDKQLVDIIDGAITPTESELDELRKKYPYFSIPDICALRDETVSDSEKKRLMATHAALTTPDNEALENILGKDMMRFADFYPPQQPPAPTTEDTIDKFLDTFGKSDSREMDALTKMIFNPMPDYASVLAAEEQKSTPSQAELDSDTTSKQDLLINNFIAKNKQSEIDTQKEAQPDNVKKSDKLTNRVENTETKQKESENSSLTESFAKVMIKNRNYSKALEIITDLSLNNPEKSIYFADQIRFLQKLIINEKKL